jgi:hypothetical protein
MRARVGDNGGHGCGRREWPRGPPRADALAMGCDGMRWDAMGRNGTQWDAMGCAGRGVLVRSRGRRPGAGCSGGQRAGPDVEGRGQTERPGVAGGLVERVERVERAPRAVGARCVRREAALGRMRRLPRALGARSHRPQPCCCGPFQCPRPLPAAIQPAIQPVPAAAAWRPWRGRGANRRTSARLHAAPAGCPPPTAQASSRARDGAHGRRAGWQAGRQAAQQQPAAAQASGDAGARQAARLALQPARVARSTIRRRLAHRPHWPAGAHSALRTGPRNRSIQNDQLLFHQPSDT